jgi:hypothetical protein
LIQATVTGVHTLEGIGVVLEIDHLPPDISLPVGGLIVLQQPDGSSSSHPFIGVVYLDKDKRSRLAIRLDGIEGIEVPSGSILVMPK